MPTFLEICDQKSAHALHDESDATCTAGHNNDGSTGQEIFENGVWLGKHLVKAGPQAKLFAYVRYPDAVWYFVYEKDEDLLERLNRLEDKE